MTYKHKLLFYFVLIISLIEGLSLSYKTYDSYQLRLNYFNEHINRSTQTYAESLRVPSWNLDEETTLNIIQSILLDKEIELVQIVYTKNALPQLIVRNKQFISTNRGVIQSHTQSIYEPLTKNLIAKITFKVSTSALERFYEQQISHAIIELLILVFINIMVIFLIMKWMTTPLLRLNHVLNKLAHNNLDVSIPYTTRKDEIGEFSRSVAVFKQNNLELADLQKSMQEKIEFQTHDLIQAKDKAETALVAKNQFLSNMSHEIRTPLNGIMGMAQLLSESNISDEDKEYLDVILKTSADLLHILTEILDYSKLDTNDINLEQIPFNLFQHIADIIKVEDLKIQDKELNIEYNYAADINKAYIGDSVHIKQVLYNVINNASKFTQQGKITINVETGSIASNHDIEDVPDTNKVPVIIKIKDTGIGISEEELSNIFEPFTQVDQSHTRKYGGLGLGLSTSKKFIALMGGTIIIDSVIDEGTTVTISIPLLELNAADLL